MDFLKSKVSTYCEWNYSLHDLSKFLPQDEFPDYKFCMPKKKIGIEVEVENIFSDLKFNRKFWRERDDGSLRFGGIEYVSSPICGNEICYAVTNLFQHLPENANFSPRTSIHIHINVRNSTLNQILSLLIIYLVSERLLYKYAGLHRQSNLYCVPIQDTEIPNLLSRFLVNQNFKSLVQNWDKYTGLNIASIHEFGTLEYRHMEGHRDIKRLFHWIDLLLHMHKYVIGQTFMDVFNELKLLNTTSAYEQFIRSVFKNLAHLIIIPDLQHDMEYAVSLIKMIKLPSDFLNQLTQLIKIRPNF